MKNFKTKLSVLVSLFLALVIATTALAGSYTFKGGFNTGSPILMITDGSTLSGVGGADLNLTMTVWADVTAVCQNNGGNTAPGRGQVNTTASDSFDLDLDENGKITFTASGDTHIEVGINVSNLMAVSPTPKDAGCPSNSWTLVDITDVTFTQVRLSGKALDGTPLFSYTYDCYYSGTTLTGCW